MRKLLLCFLCFFINLNTFAAVKAESSHSYTTSIANALSLSKQTKNDDVDTLAIIINYDLTNTITAYFTTNSTCDTPVSPNIGPRTAGIITNAPIPDTICLRDATSGAQFWQGQVDPFAVISVYVSNGQYVVYNTPITQ